MGDSPSHALKSWTGSATLTRTLVKIAGQAMRKTYALASYFNSQGDTKKGIQLY